MNFFVWLMWIIFKPYLPALDHFVVLSVVTVGVLAIAWGLFMPDEERPTLGRA